MISEPVHKKRVFILGSCVSRDAFDAIDVGERYELAGYLARTSIASIGMPEVAEQVVVAIGNSMQSAFQRRMFENDIRKATLKEISSTPHDILLLDFVDERFKLGLTGHTLFSLSGEVEKTGFTLGERAFLEPGSDSFMELWEAGLDQFLTRVDVTKVIVNRIFWAERLPDGKEISNLGWIRRNNAILQKFYSVIERNWQLRTIRYPEDLLMADPGHRWGLAPYHFAGGVYSHTLAELGRLI
jgi:Family of unknown function (DUF6270)